jgi:hypothetical protein
MSICRACACIASPFGPRVLPNQPEIGSYHYGIDKGGTAIEPIAISDRTGMSAEI